MTDSTARSRSAWRRTVLWVMTAAFAVQVLVWVGIAGGEESEVGALAYAECITSNSDVTGCTTIPDATPGGDNTGLSLDPPMSGH